jgi:O-antigen/teichoic acid export membrane protein
MNISHPVRIVKNTGVLIISQLVTMGTGVVWLGSFARYVGPSIYGNYNYALAVMALVGLLINFGMDPLLTRNIARDPLITKDYVSNGLVIKLVLAGVVFGPLFLYGVRRWEYGFTAVLIVCGLGALVDAVVGLMNSALYAFENMVYDAIGQVVRGILLIAICLPLMQHEVSFIHILWVSVALSSVRILICWHGLRKKTEGMPRHAISLSVRKLWLMLKESSAFAILAIVGVVHSNLIILLIRFILKDDSALGYFAAAQRIYLFALIGPGMFYQAIYPVLSRSFAECESKFSEIFEKGYRYLLALSFPMTVGMAILAPHSIKLIYGESFVGAVPGLRILSLGLINGPGFVMGAAMGAMNKQGVNALIFGLTVILIGLFSYVSIPKIGIEGACWAIVLGNLAGLFVYSIMLFRKLQIAYPWKWVGNVGISAGVCGVCTFAAICYIPTGGFAFLCSIVVGAGAYLLCLVAVNAFSVKDAELLSSLIPLPAAWRFHIQRGLCRKVD